MSKPSANHRAKALLALARGISNLGREPQYRRADGLLPSAVSAMQADLKVAGRADHGEGAPTSAGLFSLRTFERVVAVPSQSVETNDFHLSCHPA